MTPSRPTVLVVDDSAVMRQMVAAQLQEAGYPSVLAASGEEALALAGRQPVALVLTDWTMLPMDGGALIRQLRSQSAHAATPIVVLSTLSGSAEKAQARAAGANGWLSKPVHPDTLADVLAALLGPASRRGG